MNDNSTYIYVYEWTHQNTRRWAAIVWRGNYTGLCKWDKEQIFHTIHDLQSYLKQLHLPVVMEYFPE